MSVIPLERGRKDQISKLPAVQCTCGSPYPASFTINQAYVAYVHHVGNIIKSKQNKKIDELLVKSTSHSAGQNIYVILEMRRRELARLEQEAKIEFGLEINRFFEEGIIDYAKEKYNLELELEMEPLMPRPCCRLSVANLARQGYTPYDLPDIHEDTLSEEKDAIHDWKRRNFADTEDYYIIE